jgi:hypothetical protein
LWDDFFEDFLELFLVVVVFVSVVFVSEVDVCAAGAVAGLAVGAGAA